MPHREPIAHHHPKQRSTAWTVRRVPNTFAMPPLSERYQAMWLGADGEIDDCVRMGPRVPLFTQSFGALARGAIVPTAQGPVAVEDLLPGMRVATSQGPETLLWIGSQTLVPNGRRRPLYRIPAEALGLGRPSFDLVLGPAARIVSRSGTLRDRIGSEAALIPVEAMTDGMTVIEVAPISSVQLFHLGFASHRTLSVSGVELESVHPGRIDASIGRELLSLYMSMFPHLDGPAGFGKLAMPRLSLDEAGQLDAA
ncbi:Hint domain-containing protein [Palleronia aestuarii]|uniref:Hint domain-containing protein n=1 Tax=Palleronia aestuarii TaxID=568105 RepID=A0A2W7NCT3_9RHOB|nr:Hint domain-containing protein [Palleronia aestuarii]PZX17790.1 Hint domain-containing protein [Palleronia aestuarii]